MAIFDIYKGKKILVLLIGDIDYDARVLKTCASLRNMGANVTLACTGAESSHSKESDGFNIIRFPHPDDFILKKIYHTLRGFLPSGTKSNGEPAKASPQISFMRNFKNFALDLNFSHFMRSRKKVNLIMAEYFLKEKYDLIHCNDFDTLWAGSILKSNGSAKELIYDSHEYWPGMSGVGRKSNRLISEAEAEGIKNSDYVVTVNPLIAEALFSLYSLKNKPAVIMNCPNLYTGDIDTDEIFSPVRVIFQGKFQRYRGLENLVRAFADTKNCTLTLSGYGPLESELRRLIAQLNLTERVNLNGKYIPEDSVKILSGHDIGIITYEEIVLNNIYASPNKLFEYCMAGLAVVSSDLPFISGIITENNLGETFRNNNPGAISEILNKLTCSPELLKKYKRNARDAAFRNYSWEKQFEFYPWKPESRSQ